MVPIASRPPRLAATALDIAGSRVIVTHLGSGATLGALRNGKSVDSTFGFTALDGLCMGTRPGALDPGVVLICSSRKEVETLLYKQSGLLGISGISNDMRDLLDSAESDAQLAVEYFVYRAAKEIGALPAVLGGVDARQKRGGYREPEHPLRYIEERV